MIAKINIRQNQNGCHKERERKEETWRLVELHCLEDRCETVLDMELDENEALCIDSTKQLPCQKMTW